MQLSVLPVLFVDFYCFDFSAPLYSSDFSHAKKVFDFHTLSFYAPSRKYNGLAVSDEHSFYVSIHDELISSCPTLITRACKCHKRAVKLCLGEHQPPIAETDCAVYCSGHHHIQVVRLLASAGSENVMIARNHARNPCCMSIALRSSIHGRTSRSIVSLEDITTSSCVESSDEDALLKQV